MAKDKDKKSKADLLIEEAVRNIEKQETGETGVTPKGELNTITGEQDLNSGERLAQIQPQKVVDREAYLRLKADFENFRKRALKERQESERRGKEKILREFLDIVDNLERGLKQATDESPLSKGMRMVLGQCESWLESLGLERVQGKGSLFDPSIHDAVSQLKDTTASSGTIIEEMKRGYRWKENSELLRPASVVVSKNPEENEA